MKTIIKGLLVLTGLVISTVSADFIGDEDDTYIGFQMATSLDSMSRAMFLGDHQYSYLLVQQRDGLKDGFSISRDSQGNRVLNYLRPSTTFDFTQRRVAEYAVPIMSLEAQDGSRPKKSTTSNSAEYQLAGLVALMVISLKIQKDLEKDWETAD